MYIFLDLSIYYIRRNLTSTEDNKRILPYKNLLIKYEEILEVLLVHQFIHNGGGTEEISIFVT